MGDFYGLDNVLDLELADDQFMAVSDHVYEEAARSEPPGRFTLVFGAAFAMAVMFSLGPTGIDARWNANSVTVEDVREAYDDPATIEAAGYRQWFESLPEEDVEALVDRSAFTPVVWNGESFVDA